MAEEQLEEFGKLSETPEEEDIILPDQLDLDELRIIKDHGFRTVITVSTKIPGTSGATAANYTAPFFIAKRSYVLISVTERHETLGTDGSAVTLMITKTPDGTAPASGTDMLSAGINLRATINTNQSGSLNATLSNIQLVRGDSVTLVTTGTLTAVAGVTVTLELRAT